MDCVRRMSTCRLIFEGEKLINQQVADGLSKLGETLGGFLEGLTMFSPEFQSGSTKIVGKAFTVKMVLKSETDAPKLQGNYVRMTVPFTSFMSNTCVPDRQGPQRLHNLHEPANASCKCLLRRSHEHASTVSSIFTL